MAQFGGFCEQIPNMKMRQSEGLCEQMFIIKMGQSDRLCKQLFNKHNTELQRADPGTKVTV